HELSEPANEPLLAQVVRQVHRIYGRAETQLDAEMVCHWIDRGGTNRSSDRFWTVDPIDGTKGFLRGEQYAVALALIVDGLVVVGALACPNLPAEPISESSTGRSSHGSIFWAVRGGGAFVVPCSAEAVADPVTTNHPRALKVSLHDDPAVVR